MQTMLALVKICQSESPKKISKNALDSNKSMSYLLVVIAHTVNSMKNCRRQKGISKTGENRIVRMQIKLYSFSAKSNIGDINYCSIE